VIRAVRVTPTVLDGRIVRVSVVGARQDSAIVLEVRLEQDLLAGIPDAIAVVPLARHTAQCFAESGVTERFSYTLTMGSKLAKIDQHTMNHTRTDVIQSRVPSYNYFFYSK